MQPSPPKYQKYRIPPQFSLAQIHAKSCKLYKQPTDAQLSNPSYTQNKCHCCNQHIGKQKVSICQYVSSLRRIGQQVPLFFNFTTLMILLTILILFCKAGQIMLYDQYTLIKCKIQGIFGLNFQILMGYTHYNNLSLMIQIIVYSVVILIIKIYLKTKKYTYRAFSMSIEKRSVQLLNLSKQASMKDIIQLFQGFIIQDIQFTFRVKEYHQCMNRIAKLKKNLTYLQSQIFHHENQQKIKKIEQKLQNTKKLLQNILKNSRSKKKRLSIAFVVFSTTQQRNRALQKFQHSLFSKLFLKLCTCCSNSAIHGQHITISQAPAPDDIKWQNLQNPYLRTKIIRITSFIICTIILIFGLVSEVVIFNKNNLTDLSGQIFSSLIIFIINFMIINFLEYTTNKIQSRESNTIIKLSLIRKITFFMFINVSICPFLIIIYNYLVNQQKSQHPLDSISFTILIVCIGNMFKPLLTIISIPRFMRWYKCHKQKSKGNKSKLNQLQANQLFQPQQFPIQIYYSMLHASLMMSFFYLGCFQILIAVQLIALLLLYFCAKWMLLRICKQPRGLSLRLNNLAQSLMRFYILFYWLGTNSIHIIELLNNTNIQDKNVDILQQLFYKDIYQIITTCIVIFMLICQIFVAKIAKLIIPKKQNQLSEYFDICDQNRTYRQANMFYKIHQEDLIKISKQLGYRKKNKNINRNRNKNKNKNINENMNIWEDGKNNSHKIFNKFIGGDQEQSQEYIKLKNQQFY